MRNCTENTDGAYSPIIPWIKVRFVPSYSNDGSKRTDTRSLSSSLLLYGMANNRSKIISNQPDKTQFFARSPQWDHDGSILVKQSDLNIPAKCYCLPADWFDDERAPYGWILETESLADWPLHSVQLA